MEVHRGAACVVSSSDAQPSVTIQSPTGVITTFTPANCAAAGIKFEYKADSKLWDFHWVPKTPQSGHYCVVVHSGKTVSVSRRPEASQWSSRTE